MATAVKLTAPAVEFGDLPARRARGGSVWGVYDEAMQALRDRPFDWARVTISNPRGSRTQPQVASTRSYLARRYGSEYEFRTRTEDGTCYVWARYIGTA